MHILKIEPVEIFDFGFSVAAPEGTTVTQGDSISYIVQARVLSDTLEPISARVSGLPPDATASFSDTDSPLIAILKISTSTTTPAGTYTITIIGINGGLVRDVEFPLMVLEAPEVQPPIAVPAPAFITPFCGPTAQAILNAVGGCGQIDPAAYPNIHATCCQEVNKETLLSQLDAALADGEVDEQEKAGLLYALNAYLS